MQQGAEARGAAARRRRQRGSRRRLPLEDVQRRAGAEALPPVAATDCRTPKPCTVHLLLESLLCPEELEQQAAFRLTA